MPVCFDIFFTKYKNHSNNSLCSVPSWKFTLNDLLVSRQHVGIDDKRKRQVMQIAKNALHHHEIALEAMLWLQ